MQIQRTAKKVIDLLSIVVLVGAALSAAVRVIGLRAGMDDRQIDRRPHSVSQADLVQAVRDGQWLGPRNATVVALVYSDYACGFCGQLDTSLRILRRRYPQHFATVIKHFVEPSSLQHYRVPQAAECAAEQDMFAEYHAAAFDNGRAVTYTSGWRAIADSAKVPDMALFEECVASGRQNDRIEQQYEEGKRFGVTATPTLFVNETMVAGAPTTEQLDSLVAMRFRK